MFNFINKYLFNKICVIKQEILLIFSNIIAIVIIIFFLITLFLLLIFFLSITLALLIGKCYANNYIFGFGVISMIYTIFFIICLFFRKFILDKIFKKLIFVAKYI